MFKHKWKVEEEPYEATNNKNKVVDDVKEELAGREDFLTDTQGLRLAYESPDRIYRNGSILYIAGTKDTIDFYGDLKPLFYQTRNTKRYKDVDTFIKDDAIEIDGKKHYGISDVISHSLGSAVGQHINNEYGNIFRSRSYGSPFVSGQRQEDTGNNLRIRKAGDPVSMFDNGAFNLNRSSLNPFDNHRYADIANVKYKEGNEPITREEFMEQFD